MYGCITHIYRDLDEEGRQLVISIWYSLGKHPVGQNWQSSEFRLANLQNKNFLKEAGPFYAYSPGETF